MERDYFDARFDGLEKLMEKSEKNLTAYVGAVSKSVEGVRSDLQAHKENADAHGAGASSRQGNTMIQWLGLIVSIIALGGVIVPLLRK